LRAILLCILGLASLLAPSHVRGAQPPGFTLKDGDRIVLVGDTFIERDQRYGYLETILTLQNPDKTLVFRNLGWSGDTVEGVSRSGFDPPEAGFEQLKQQILAIKPTVVVVGYGMADSFAGDAGLPRFEKGLNRLLEFIDGIHARVVLLSPIAHEDLGRPLPDPAQHNAQLKIYTHSIADTARRRGALFIDLFQEIPSRRKGAYLTDNGIHLTENGYRLVADLIDRPLVPTAVRQAPRVELAADGKLGPTIGARVDQVEPLLTGIRFRLAREILPISEDETTALYLKITGLPPGRFALKVDGQIIDTKSNGEWNKGVRTLSSLDTLQFELLRRTINRKNLLFFYRWRPQNHTYLFGFRKHEQGNNAIEIPQFDPLVAEKEAEIARLKQAIPHVYELTCIEREVAR
jgi:lysophospholipase L1-like esterase